MLLVTVITAMIHMMKMNRDEIKAMTKMSIVFKGYAHRRHRKTGRQLPNNKKDILNKIVDKEHGDMMSDAT